MTVDRAEVTVHELMKTATMFREVNERIEGVNEAFAATEADFFCECGTVGCTETIRLTLAEYERIRANPLRYLTVPGHERASVCRIVSANERFSVVEAHVDEAERMSRALDPRRSGRSELRLAAAAPWHAADPPHAAQG